MKKLTPLFWIGIYLLPMLFGGAINGCKSPETTAYKTIGTQVITVEAAKKAVAEAYVAKQISEKDFQAIRAISNKYDDAVKVERDAVMSYRTGSDTNALSKAMIAVTASSADLMALILKFLPPANVAKLKGL